jgi:hypothetical protein
LVSLKETVRVRLEIDFELLIAELRHLEDDTARMSIEKLVQVWGPEMKEARIMLHLIDLKEKGNE